MFGVARGTVIVLVVLFVLNVFVSGAEWWQQSTLIPYGMVLIEESKIFIGDMNAVTLLIRAITWSGAYFYVRISWSGNQSGCGGVPV